MLTIDLTPQQADELIGLLNTEIDMWTNELKGGDPTDADHIAYSNRLSVLYDILHLLEIA